MIDTEHYEDGMAESVAEQYQKDDDYKIPLDIDRIRFDESKLMDADKELEELHNNLLAIKLKIFNEKLDLEEEGFKDGSKRQGGYLEHHDQRV